MDNLQKKNYTQLINIGEDVSIVSSLENINYSNYRRPCFPRNVESVLVRMQRNRHFHIVLLTTWISNMSLWSQSGNIYYGLKCTCPLAQHSHFWEFMPLKIYRYTPVYCSKWYSGKKTENNWMFIDRGMLNKLWHMYIQDTVQILKEYYIFMYWPAGKDLKTKYHPVIYVYMRERYRRAYTR